MKIPVSYGTRAYVLLLAIVATGLTLVALGYWRLGLVVIGGAFIAASIVRLFLSERHAGALGVRMRWLDVVWLGGLGAALVALALVVPPSVL